MLKIKQLTYPREFRIYSVGMNLEAFHKLQEVIQNLEISCDNGDDRISQKFLADLSIGAWRLRKKMLDKDTQQPLTQIKRAFRHLESIVTTLEKEGIEIHDHDNMPFDPGMTLKVLAFQPTAGLDREFVIETIKPTINYNESRLVIGEVIVGTPLKNKKEE